MKSSAGRGAYRVEVGGSRINDVRGAQTPLSEVKHSQSANSYQGAYDRINPTFALLKLVLILFSNVSAFVVLPPVKELTSVQKTLFFLLI